MQDLFYPVLNAESLLKCCIKFLSKNIEIFENSEYLGVIPSSIKSRIIRYVIHIGKGFHNDRVLGQLLHQQICHLDLSNSTIGSETLVQLTRLSPTLKELKLSKGKCVFKTNDLLVTLPQLPYLEALQVGGIDQITDDVIECLAKNCKKLDLLDVSRCNNITDKCAESLKMVPLTRLSLAHTNITDKFLMQLPESPLNNNLEDLNLSYCNVTYQGLLKLCWTKLQYIGFEGTHVTDFDFMKNSGNIRFMQWTIST